MIKSKLKVLLAENDMTQLQLSAITGIRQPTISAICNNHAKQIPIDTLNKICKTLNCDVGDLLKYIPDDEA